MTRTTFLLVVFFLCCRTVKANSDGNDDGKIIERIPYHMPKYNELPLWMQKKYHEKEYKQEFLSKTIEFTKIRYLSDGLKIVGFILKPAVTRKKLPVVIYNRPGVGEGARISNSNFQQVYEMYKLAEAGFVVLASQFRGVDGSEGKDEVCGSDLHDVLNLYPLLKSLSYADSTKIYMMGTSRGGTMALQAIKAGLKLKGVAVVGAVTDWKMQLSGNDEFGKQYWPDYEKDREFHFASRSAMKWIDKINIPLLIIHGGNDESVNPLQVLRFVEKLQEAKKSCQFILYAGDDHTVTVHLDEKLALIVDWFKTTHDQ